MKVFESRQYIKVLLWLFYSMTMTMIYSWLGRPKHSEVRTGTNSWNKTNDEMYDMTSYLDMDSWINRAPVDSHHSLVQKWMWILHSGFIALIAASQNPISMIPYWLLARFVFFLVQSWENHRVGNTVIESQKCGLSGGRSVCVQPLSSDSWYRLQIFISAWDRSPSKLFDMF